MGLSMGALRVAAAGLLFSSSVMFSVPVAAAGGASASGFTLEYEAGGVFGPTWACGLTGQHRVCAFLDGSGLRFSDAGDVPDFSGDHPIGFVSNGSGLSPVNCDTDGQGFCSTAVRLAAGTYVVTLESNQLGVGVGHTPSFRVTLPGEFSGPTGLPLPVNTTPASHYLLEAASDGGVFTFGSARFFGSMGGRRLSRPVVGIATPPAHEGYWLVASDGGVFSFGDAHFYGSTGNLRLARPVVGMAASADGRGYWLVASDGGIFTFGTARFHGSTGNLKLAKPIVGMAATPDGGGYWLVASDGGVFAFGDARFYGSEGGRSLAEPITGIAATSDGGGYWLVGSDGGVFAFGDARFYASGTNESSALGGPPQLTFDAITAQGGGGYALAFTEGIGYTAFDAQAVIDRNYVEAYGAMLGPPSHPIVSVTGS